jgi:Cu(I)/Ag(I) efflux system membrane protein CusA/SilA
VECPYGSPGGGGQVDVGRAESASATLPRYSCILKSLDDFRVIPLAVLGATPVLLRDVATLQMGPKMRRGLAELDGQGEVTGGVVVMRSGKNARTTIEAVKAKLAALKPSLPAGVEIVETYDRSKLVDRAIDNLSVKLLEEFIVAAIARMHGGLAFAESAGGATRIGLVFPGGAGNAA